MGLDDGYAGIENWFSWEPLTRQQIVYELWTGVHTCEQVVIQLTDIWVSKRVLTIISLKHRGHWVPITLDGYSMQKYFNIET